MVAERAEGSHGILTSSSMKLSMLDPKKPAKYQSLNSWIDDEKVAMF